LLFTAEQGFYTGEGEKTRADNIFHLGDLRIDHWPVIAEDFQEILPFHLTFDKKFSVHAAGHIIERYLPFLVHRPLMDSFLAMSSPKLLTFGTITSARYEPANMRCACGTKYCSLAFEGSAMINSDDSSMAVCNCIPLVLDFAHLKYIHSFLVSDFRFESVSLDKIFLSMHLCSAKLVSEKLVTIEDLLHKSYADFEVQRRKFQSVLYSVLPSFAIDKYIRGEDFPPSRLDSLTVLFSEIKGFSVICESCKLVPPISLLSDLYSKYDDLTNSHDVLKVSKYLCS